MQVLLFWEWKTVAHPHIQKLLRDLVDARLRLGEMIDGLLCGLQSSSNPPTIFSNLPIFARAALLSNRLELAGQASP